MEEKPPAYYKWSQFDDKCTCGRSIGIHQRKFERITKEKMKEGMKLNEARIEAIRSLGIKKMCCMRDLTHFSKNFIFDTYLQAYTDITSSQSGENYKTGINSNVGYEFLPLTNGVLGFDMTKYCYLLESISKSNYDKLGIFPRNHGNIAVFPNYYRTQTKDMPEVAYTQEPLNLLELAKI